jgi:glycosyltransferase involved in cell wall biosynthesis
VRSYGEKSGPLVSVLLPTYNRRRYLPVSLSSIVHQDYRDLEIFVIRDGGEEVSDIVNSFNDSRIVFINREENCGLPHTLNEALVRVKGKYICYLGDDDLYYPHHVSTLVDVLENKTDCQAAYSDLYKVYCKIMPDGSRQVLSKVVEISRDFDRFLMLYFNQALHVSLMHSRSLLEKTGLYNEQLSVLIDWDMTRRLAFFTDFYHTYEITGEFYGPVGESDRISCQKRKDRIQFNKNVFTIRTTRPTKPWPKIKDLSIIFTPEHLNNEAGKTLGLIWRHTFYPYQVYLPLPQEDLDGLRTDMPNIIRMPVRFSASEAERMEAVLAVCEGDYVAVVPGGFPVKEMYVEDPLYALINSSAGKEAFELEGSTDAFWGVVIGKNDLLYARRSFPNLPLRESLKAAGIVIKKLRPEEIPFQFDSLLREAQLAEKDGNCGLAAEVFGYIGKHYQNELWMKTLAAKAFFKAGALTKAAELSGEVNQRRAVVDTLLLEGRINQKQKNFESAIKLLERAKKILEGRELLWTQQGMTCLENAI